MIELHFTKTNGPADEAIDNLIELVGGIYFPEIVREMVLAALKAGQENNDRGTMKFLNTTMKEMRYTETIFGAYRSVKKVTVFGSARTQPDEPVYRMARLFGQKLVDTGFMVITGGGPGIMQAANEGAGPEHSFGVNIQLPFEQQPNPVLIGNPRLITYKYFFSRKVAFIKEADAIALFPGGFGTLDEAMETLTLLQTGKQYPLPLVLVDEPGGTYWQRWIRFLREELLKEGYISDSDFDLFDCVDSVDEAIMRISSFYRRYHSMRYVNNKLVLRITADIDTKSITAFNKRFSDILIPGGAISLSSPLAEEADEPEIADLPRLIVDFNCHDHGRLRQLIDEINTC
jgi:uncharacterized protein (TIGR00730 family)